MYISPGELENIKVRPENIRIGQMMLAQMSHNKTQMQETTTIAADYLRNMAKHIEQMLIVEGLEDYAKELVYIGAFLAKLYDFTAAGMKKEDRNFFARFMNKQTRGEYSVGIELSPHWRSSSTDRMER